MQGTCGSGKTTESAFEDYKSSKARDSGVWLWGASKHRSGRAAAVLHFNCAAVTPKRLATRATERQELQNVHKEPN